MEEDNMLSVLIEINVTVKDMDEAVEIADDLHDILNDCGIKNSVNTTNCIEECD